MHLIILTVSFSICSGTLGKVFFLSLFLTQISFLSFFWLWTSRRRLWVDWKQLAKQTVLFMLYLVSPLVWTFSPQLCIEKLLWAGNCFEKHRQTTNIKMVSFVCQKRVNKENPQESRLFQPLGSKGSWYFAIAKANVKCIHLCSSFSQDCVMGVCVWCVALLDSFRW